MLGPNGHIAEKRIRCLHNRHELNLKLNQIIKGCAKRSHTPCIQYTGMKTDYLDYPQKCQDQTIKIITSEDDD